MTTSAIAIAGAAVGTDGRNLIIYSVWRAFPSQKYTRCDIEKRVRFVDDTFTTKRNPPSSSYRYDAARKRPGIKRIEFVTVEIRNKAKKTQRNSFVILPIWRLISWEDTAASGPVQS